MSKRPQVEPIRQPTLGDVGISVFPKGEDILISGLRFGSVTLHGAGEAWMR